MNQHPTDTKASQSGSTARGTMAKTERTEEQRVCPRFQVSGGEHHWYEDEEPEHRVMPDFSE